jgi:hypothetical protein
MVRFAASRLFTAADVTPALLTEITDDIMSTLVRSEQGRRQHWFAKNFMPPPLESRRTPWTAR